MERDPAGWTLEELGERVTRALAIDYPGPANGQVRAIPDARTIRYYASLGLLDRPAATRGRTGLYGRRHLLQLVAIKRLQVEGCSLQQVQQQLLGLGDAELERLARLPELDDKSPPPPGPVLDRGRCWRELPSPEPAAQQPDRLAAEPAALAAELRMLVPLGGAAYLLLPAAPLSRGELEAIRAAARPLIERLRERGLLGEPAGDP
jgi:DNA-binding transcriptional MerR regulator